MQALPKGDRGPLAVDLATELGVDRIVPWTAARCVTRWRDDRVEKGVAKWRAAARAASKQSRRPRLPEVTEPMSTREVCGLLADVDLALVLHERARRPLAELDIPRAGTVAVVVGPEGGLTDGEVVAFRAAGAQAVRLGDRGAADVHRRRRRAGRAVHAHPLDLSGRSIAPSAAIPVADVAGAGPTLGRGGTS